MGTKAAAVGRFRAVSCILEAWSSRKAPVVDGLRLNVPALEACHRMLAEAADLTDEEMLHGISRAARHIDRLLAKCKGLDPFKASLVQTKWRLSRQKREFRLRRFLSKTANRDEGFN